MPLLTVILVIAVVGIALYAVNRFIPMQSAVQSILNVVVVVALVAWLLQVFGLIDPLLDIRVG